MTDQPSGPRPILITQTELFWLTAGLWMSGICLLALLPVLLMPRLGQAGGLAVSYVAFFVAWQPLQRILQRQMGPSAVMRVLALVASAAMLAYYLRDALVEQLIRASTP